MRKISIRRNVCNLAALVLAATAIAMPSAQAAETTPLPYHITWDNFRSGFADDGPGAKWFSPPTGSFPHGDRIATTNDGKLSVVPTGTNPATHRPAFVFTTGQEVDGGGGEADQLKWIALAAHPTGSGFLGFDTVPGQVLSCQTTMQVRTFGMDRQPFGNAVSNPDADPRIGTAAMIMLDMETRTVFDFFVSNKQIYAFYERLPQDGGAAAFSYAVPVMPHVPDQPNKLSISFDKSAGVATWKVDDKPVLTVNRVGYRTLDRKYLLLDHGGPEQLVSPRQFTCGMGMFTLLDGAVSGGPGLVRLSSQPDFYFNTRQGEPTPQRFLDEKSVDSNRLWGQGVQLKVGPLEIESRSRNGNSSD